MLEFKKQIIDLKNALNSAKSQNIDFSKNIDNDKAITDFKERKDSYYRKTVETKFKNVKSNVFELNMLIKFNINNKELISKITDIVQDLELENEISQSLDNIISLLDQLDYPKLEEKIKFKKVDLPEEIRMDINSDISEIERCFKAECFRSVVILCGRILETALHRKYYEATNVDILEKNPGIGLGKLIAKLAEENVNFDPGLTQQIHLINQVRVFSVHKKQVAFYPSKAQANATILYTLDVLDKLFKK